MWKFYNFCKTKISKNHSQTRARWWSWLMSNTRNFHLCMATVLNGIVHNNYHHFAHHQIAPTRTNFKIYSHWSNLNITVHRHGEQRGRAICHWDKNSIFEIMKHKFHHFPISSFFYKNYYIIYILLRKLCKWVT